MGVHKPEWVEGCVSVLAGAARDGLELYRTRPLRLFDPQEEVMVFYAVPEGPPARLSWRRGAFLMVRFEGPERIASERWRDRSGTQLRDYNKN